MLVLSTWHAKRKIRRIASRYCRRAKVFSFEGHRHLVVWITTQTDEERDFMRASPELVPEFRRVLLAAGYPEVGFEFESQQTVDRDFDGNWWYAVR